MWVCDRDGGNRRRLTHLRAAVTGFPSWSPNGRHIVFHSRPEGQADIYVVVAQGGAPRQLTSHAADDAMPSWSRDGKRIYFISTRSGGYSIWRMSVEGLGAKQLTKGRSSQPRESTDGAVLYFYRPKENGVYMMPLKTGEPVGAEALLTATGRRDPYFAFLVGRNGLYFQSEQGRLQFLDMATRKVTESVQIHGRISSLSPDEQSILYAHPVASNRDLVMLESIE